MRSPFPSISLQKGLPSSLVLLPCRLFSHVGDPFLDDPLPREYVLYLRPTGPLAQKLSDFWQQSKQICGKNKAHNIFPHITLCQFFMVSLVPDPSLPSGTWSPSRMTLGNLAEIVRAPSDGWAFRESVRPTAPPFDGPSPGAPGVQCGVMMLCTPQDPRDKPDPLTH